MEGKVESVLKSHVPSLAPEIKDYCLGVLCDESNDFDDADDLYDAVGEIIASSSDSIAEPTIKALCTTLAGILVKESTGDTNGRVEFESESGQRVLPGAVDMAKASEANQEPELTSIFLVKKEEKTNVDAKKLARAEEKLRDKKEKRILNDARLPNPIPMKAVTATASQSLQKSVASDDNSGDIRLYNVDVSFGDKQLLVNADLTMASGKRYGLVGRNGIGKTTFFKMLSSRQLEIPSKIRMLHVEQEVAGDDRSILDAVLAADVRREELLRLEKELSRQVAAGQTDANTSEQLSDIYRELEEREANKAPAKAARILAGLGFSESDQCRPTREFSGGWRMRVSLAQGLFLQPDLLLLDEPTNMLDMKAIYWLENHLSTWPSTLFVVSHDRNFLNSVCTDIILLANKKFDVFRGNYDNFEKVKEEKLKQQQREYDSQMAFRAHAQEFIDKFRYNAKRASLVQSKIKMLEKLPTLIPVDPEARVVLKFPECEKLSPPVLQLNDASFKYSGQDRDIFRNINVGADTESRICIVGENGAGKTTLLKLLKGGLDPTKGQRNGHRGLKMAYFTQHHVDQLDMNLTPLHLAAERFPGFAAEEYRTALGRFGVTGDLALQSITTLSGGQGQRNGHRGLKMAYFTQHHVDQLDMNLTPLHLAAERFPGFAAEEYRTALGRFGVTGDLALQSITTLSGGQGQRNGHRGLKMAYFTQHHVDQLDMNLTPLHLAAERFPGFAAEEYRTALGRFGVTGDLALQSITTLSGGQKSRLAFALIAMQKPNFMILDEPTNHLDVESVEALGKALNNYQGGVVLVSHDERLIELVCQELWVVRKGSVERLEGGLAEYRKLVLSELKDIF